MNEKGTQRGQRPALKCRSVGPKEEPCAGKRGHKRQMHESDKRIEWNGGVRTPAIYRVNQEGSHLTEADYQTWMRL
jgi:hypothetical protein